AQVFADLFSETVGVIATEARSEKGELTASAARGQPFAASCRIQQTSEQFAQGADQRIGALPAQALIETAEIVDTQQQQIAFGILLVDHQLMAQADIELAAVGQAGQAVLIGFLA